MGMRGLVAFDVTGGISGEGDGANYSVSGLYGINFNNDRSNFTIGVNYSTREAIQHGDRDWSRNNGVASDDQNPALRFQTGDIDPTATPNNSDASPLDRKKPQSHTRRQRGDCILLRNSSDTARRSCPFTLL